jgi:hypothetical protein
MSKEELARAISDVADATPIPRRDDVKPASPMTTRWSANANPAIGVARRARCPRIGPGPTRRAATGCRRHDKVSGGRAPIRRRNGIEP